MTSPTLMESVETNGKPIIGRTLMLTETLNGKVIGTWCCTSGDEHDVREAMFDDLVSFAAEKLRKDE